MRKIAESIGTYPPGEPTDHEVIEQLARLPVLDYERQREQVAKAMGSRVSVLDGQVAARRREIEAKEKPAGGAPEEMSEGDRAEAQALLRRPDLLEQFLAATERLGCVGEEEPKVMLYLGLTSRKLDDPINITVKSESSAGKSYTVGNVARFFPREEVLEFSAMTRKALFHRKDDLSHKALIIYERSGAEEADYSIRTLQSEKKLIFSMPVKDPDTGQIETRDFEVAGPIAYVETTTRAHLHPENETRCFDLFIDESEAQTERIFRAQDRRYLGQAEDPERLLRPWLNAQRLLKPYRAVIPYVEHIRFPTRPLRVRRDRLRLLALIEANALLHQEQRQKRVQNGADYLVATVEDYAVAYGLAQKVLAHTLAGTTPRLVELVNIAWEKATGNFTRQDLETWTVWPTSTVNRWAPLAARGGFFEVVEGVKGKSYVYRLGKRVGAPPGLLPPEELARLLATCSPAQNLPSAREQVSCTELLEKGATCSPAQGI